MEKATFDSIKKNFGRYSSFAIWKKGDIDNLEIIEKEIGCLHGKVIFVAYNASGEIKDFQNFHKTRKGGRDSWLASTIGEHPFLRGSYMTDFFKDDFAKKEGGVEVSEDIIRGNREILVREMSVFAGSPILVAVGRKAQKIIKDSGMECEYIPHYSGHITRKEFGLAVLELARVLEEGRKISVKQKTAI